MDLINNTLSSVFGDKTKQFVEKISLTTELSQKPGFAQFASLLNGDSEEAKKLKASLGKLFPAPEGAAAADPETAMLKQLKNITATNPDFFQQANAILLNDKGQVRPEAIAALDAVASNADLTKKLTESMATPAKDGANMLATLADTVKDNPQALTFVAQNPDMVAQIMDFKDPPPGQIMKDMGAIAGKLQGTPIMAALSKDVGGGAEKALGQNMIALLKTDKDALKKLNTILGAPGAQDFLTLVSEDDNLRAGFTKAILTGNGDPKTAADALDAVYGAVKKNKNILEETTDFAKKHPKIFKIATNFVGQDPSMAIGAVEAIGGMAKYLEMIPAGLKEFFAKIIGMIAPGLNGLGSKLGMGEDLGDQLQNWIAPTDGQQPVVVSNNDGDMSKKYNVRPDNVFGADGQPVPVASATQPDSDKERTYTGVPATSKIG